MRFSPTAWALAQYLGQFGTSTCGCRCCHVHLERSYSIAEYPDAEIMWGTEIGWGQYMLPSA